MVLTAAHDKHEARGTGFKHLTPTREAIQTLLQKLSVRLESEEVPVDSSLGRVLAEDIISKVDLPPFDKAAMDGLPSRLKTRTVPQPQHQSPCS